MMNMKKRLCVFLALALLLGATGCAPEAASNTDPAETDTGKVEDPFVQPSESSATEAIPTTAPAETDPGKVEDPFVQPSENSTAPENSDSPEPSQGITRPTSHGIGFGLSISGSNPELAEELGLNYVYDEKSTYSFLAYDGGEMCLPIYLQTQGYEEEGLGVLLFLNGLPQPYRVEGETEYSYMHTFYPEDGKHYPVLYFIPVTGQAGDRMEMWGILIERPEMIPTNDDYHTSPASTGGGTAIRVQFNATPPAQELPEAPNRILSQAVSYADTTYSETSRLSAEDLLTLIYAECTTATGSKGSSLRYNISADRPIKLRFTVYGSPLVDYRLVYFLDYVPVAVSMEDLAFIEIESGRKTIVETTVDLSGFNGYSFLLPVLVPVNTYVSYDGEVQNVELTGRLMARAPTWFQLSAASNFQGMLDLNDQLLNRR